MRIFRRADARVRIRDAERFRESLKFACSDMVVWPVLGVEVRPGVHKLDLSIWEAEVAKPLCNYLRRLADEMANGGTDSRR